MFVDRSKIQVKAGDGGKGCESFYQRRPMRYPIRDGGDGGKGGDVIVKAASNVHTLLDFRYRQHFKAESGKHGSSNLKKGKNGKDCLLLVPPGTIIRDAANNHIIRDLDKIDEQVIVVKGGKGGIGNNKKKITIPECPGQEMTLLLELKLIADIGLIGYPNAGKSSFLNAVSGAKSKVAAFPFSTIKPVLGVLKSKLSDSHVTIADIPGIVEGAHQGKGLGIEFLRHIERTKVLLFVIDMAGTDQRNPLEDYANLLQELQHYDRRLLKKPQIIALNKMDVPEAEANLKEFKHNKKKADVFEISCKSKKGIEKLADALLTMFSENSG
ncbi:MAG: Obg family GTPase CgtA [PVC group bacterium]|nr:Obg family GTPase CgtA [PVC group bacterium]